MKSIKIFSAFFFMMSMSTAILAQDKTETFTVNGNCGMCKSSIEKAAKAAGATTADWNKESKALTVTYNSTTTNTAKIQQKIADVGYDNVGFTATVEAYNKLHGCCKYERKELKATTTSTTTTKASCCKGGEEKCNHDMANKADCCKDGKCTKEGHNGKDCCKDGKCTKEGHEGKDCCKDSKCTNEGHEGKDCCKKAEQ